MRYLIFLLFTCLIANIAYAGPEDKWVYVGSASQFDGIALLLGIGAFAWAYIIFRDFKGGRRKS